LAEYRNAAQLASTSAAGISEQQQQPLASRTPFPPTTVPEHLQAQYRQFVQQRHQHHVAKQRALRARAAAAGHMDYSSEATAAAVAASRLPSPSVLGSPGPAAAWSAAGLPSQQQQQQQGRPSSSGSAAADASALLTATGQAGSAAEMQQLAGAALAAAAEVQLSCPLPSDLCSSSDAAAGTADEIWANCGGISEPLPVLPAIYRSHSAPSGPPAAAGGHADAPVRTTSSNVELAPSSIGCLGRWAVSPPGTPRVQQSGRRKQPRKLAEVASGWLKQLAAKKAGTVRA
jgi:hypothetical protein